MVVENDERKERTYRSGPGVWEPEKTEGATWRNDRCWGGVNPSTKTKASKTPLAEGFPNADQRRTGLCMAHNTIVTDGEGESGTNRQGETECGAFIARVTYAWSV
jgi:hypothetical protein